MKLNGDLGLVLGHLLQLCCFWSTVVGYYLYQARIGVCFNPSAKATMVTSGIRAGEAIHSLSLSPRIGMTNLRQKAFPGKTQATYRLQRPVRTVADHKQCLYAILSRELLRFYVVCLSGHGWDCRCVPARPCRSI